MFRSRWLVEAADILPRRWWASSICCFVPAQPAHHHQVSGSTTWWYHHDQIGSTRLVTSATGTSQATYTYDPYGGLASSTGSITNPFRYCGQYQDAESGFYYLRSRYLDTTTAQFLSVDSAVDMTRQPYAYVDGGPLNASDPSGRCGFALWILFTSGCLQEQVAPALKGTGLGDFERTGAQAAINVVNVLQNNFVVGYSGCVLVCVGASFQSGVFSLQGGGTGVFARGPYFGYATLPAQQRAPTSAVYGLGLGLSCSWSEGDPSGSLNGENPKDQEVDASLGFGGQAGAMQTIFSVDISKPLSWIGSWIT